MTDVLEIPLTRSDQSGRWQASVRVVDASADASPSGADWEARRAELGDRYGGFRSAPLVRVVTTRRGRILLVGSWLVWLVDGELYYGGDSYTVPPVPVNTLAAPIGAPWLKIGEAMDYVLAVKPKRSFPIHDMTLSQAGKSMTQDRIRAVTEQGGGEFFVLEPGQSYDL